MMVTRSPKMVFEHAVARHITGNRLLVAVLGLLLVGILGGTGYLDAHLHDLVHQSLQLVP